MHSIGDNCMIAQLLEGPYCFQKKWLLSSLRPCVLGMAATSVLAIVTPQLMLMLIILVILLTLLLCSIVYIIIIELCLTLLYMQYFLYEASSRILLKALFFSRSDYSVVLNANTIPK